MRKILSLLIISVLVVFVSCDKLNESPEFSDSEAFVSFDDVELSVDENGGTLTIPVTLASINGIATTVTYTAIDSTAKENVNFSFVDPTKTLTFDADNRTQNIVVNITDNPGVFTGDIKFLIQLSVGGSTVKVGAENTCTVNINDIDHPLAAILGTYHATADSYFASRGSFDWTITFSKDADDVSIVWISNLDPYFAKYGYVAPSYNYFYGVVNSSLTQISIPTGQKLGYQETTLEGFDNSDPDAGAEAQTVIMNIQDGGATIVIPYSWGIYSDGWWNLFYGGITLTKTTK
jgi:hypothetical protein